MGQRMIPILHRDTHLLVIDKPAGLAVHPGPKTPDSLEDHLVALAFDNKRLPVISHRLDRDTSGCLVLARHPKAVRRVGQMFEAGLVQKTYWAVLEIPARRRQRHRSTRRCSRCRPPKPGGG